MKRFLFEIAFCIAVVFSAQPSAFAQNNKVVGTNVTVCYDTITTIPCPVSSSDPFYGQFPGSNKPSYHFVNSMIVADSITGLMWQRSPDLNGNNNGIVEKADKLTRSQISARVQVLNSTNWGGYSDWRAPAIKELYSITDWNGTDPSGMTVDTSQLTPFLNDTYFQFAYGQTDQGERIIDSQYASGTLYVDSLQPDGPKLFGMNFADGRIKGYGLTMPGGSEKTFLFIAIRGNTSYGINNFKDNGDQTVTDNATGLMWTKDDSQAGMNWETALAWAQASNAADYCGHTDWRLPNTKELQSIVDYTRSPGTTHTAAIDPVFNCSAIINEGGLMDWPYFWTSTTHRSFDGTMFHGASGLYVCFGTAAAWGQKPGNTFYSFYDAHGAGAQRSDPKSGTYKGDSLGLDSLGHTVYARGPQGDILRINNYVRLVRGGTSSAVMEKKKEPSIIIFPNPAQDKLTIMISGTDNFEACLLNTLGQTLILTSSKTMDVSNIPEGIYILNVRNSGYSANKKVIIKR